MKKIMALLAFSLPIFMLNSAVMAAPPHSDSAYAERLYGPRGHMARSDQDAGDSAREQRRMREERGVSRLRQHKWQTGYIMPQHYRGNGYKVEYQNHDLPKPSRNQQWYKVNNDYLLVDSDKHSIIRIMDQ